MQEIYREPVKEELIAQRIQEIKAHGVVAAASLTPQKVERWHELALDAGLDILVVQGTVISAEHVSSQGHAAQPQGVRARAADPRRARRLCQLPHGPAPDAHRRGRRARGRRPRRGLHHARRARHRRPAGDRDRRRRGRPLAAHARDGRLLPRDRRRRHAHGRRRREGDRLRRRRRDDRLAARPRLRGARPRLPLGHGHLPPDAPARRARADDAERLARGDHHRPRARERRHVQPDGRPAHLDGHLRLPGHRRVQPGRADGRARRSRPRASSSSATRRSAWARAAAQQARRAGRRRRRVARDRPDCVISQGPGSSLPAEQPSRSSRSSARSRPTRSSCSTTAASTRS